eukprot:CAMPEP_0184012824 /NCGR_PEP_ID=MMETSP0954-20121128/4657_1 /TAXON_ID=627963 /ORGANISM="Aplanochytrium sp, Strain PBS07" /LENGTH=1056 /DNA_ID=CAMNT_0026292915 /DNA_START=183 /DNA_END=3354 /DNA_ORIENTATION=-
MSTAETLNQIRNLEVLNSGFSLVGRKVKLGDFFGVVSQYKPLEDSFDIQFEVNGPAFPVTRATLQSIILPPIPKQGENGPQNGAPPPPPPPPQGVPPPPPPGPPPSMFNSAQSHSRGINTIGANLDLNQQMHLLKQQHQGVRTGNMNPYMFTNPSAGMPSQLMQNPGNDSFGQATSSPATTSGTRSFRRTNSLPNLNLAAVSPNAPQPPQAPLPPIPSPTNSFHQSSSFLGMKASRKQQQRRRHSQILQRKYNSGHVTGGLLNMNSLLNSNVGQLENVMEIEEEKHGINVLGGLQTAPIQIGKSNMLHSIGQASGHSKVSAGFLGLGPRETKPSPPASSRKLADATTTKTGVFKTMHSCYRCMSGMSGRQDAYYGANMIPVYSFIEKSLQTPSNINAARLSALRSRYLMKRTLQQVKDILPCPPEKYIINSITTACPICGRAIALNKLASHENWCKHLECSHGEIGASIAKRFRALDKNLGDKIPELKTEVKDEPKPTNGRKKGGSNQYSWVDIEKRADMAPLDTSIFDTPECLVPFTTRFHWQAIMFDQLLSEGALLPYSVLTQELVAFGFQYYGLELKQKHRFKRLVNFQESIMRASRAAFSVYSNGDERLHPDLITITDGDNTKANDLNAMNIQNNVSAQRVMSDLMNVKKEESESKKVPSSVEIPALQRWIKTVRSCYAEQDGISFSSIEASLIKEGGTQAVNALRLIVLRRRQLLVKTLKDVIDFLPAASDPSDLFPREAELSLNPAAYVVNVLYTMCPLCQEIVESESDCVHDDSWCKHLETKHGAVGSAIAARYRALERNENENDIPEITSHKEAIVLQRPLTERSDLAPLKEDPSTRNLDEPRAQLIPLITKIDWRALMFDDLLIQTALTPESVLTQEIVVMGLFYFGLVNQRSPQKFGQYPQLQAFQKLVHETSSSAYDVYCGVGIKEGELGSSHTRGRPVHATKHVIRRYNHYGLSHKSLQRNDRRNEKKNRRSSEMFRFSKNGKGRRASEIIGSDSPLSMNLKRKGMAANTLSRRRRSSVEPVFHTGPTSGLPVTYIPIKENQDQ